MLVRSSGFVGSELVKLLCENKFNSPILVDQYKNKIKDYIIWGIYKQGNQDFYVVI